jgi:glycosyltransferase involved in cell wall biosynthesis
MPLYTKGSRTMCAIADNPKVSVLLPAYNAEAYLASAIESVLRQTFTDFELIAVDDGSIDNSLSILHRYERTDPRVRVISRPNTGIVGALNDAFHASRGQLLARMDGDDLCLPERFARQVRHMDEHPDTVLLGANVMVMDADSDDVAPLKGLQFTHDRIDAALLERQWPVVHPAVMIRRTAMERLGGYREGTFPHEDHDLFLRLAEVGRIEALPEVLLRYRRHPKSVSWDSRSYGKMESIVREACARRGIPFHEEDPTTTDRRRTPPTEPERLLRGKLYRTWAWHALSAGNISTARKYAFRAVRCRPLERENLKLLACIARGH